MEEVKHIGGGVLRRWSVEEMEFIIDGFRSVISQNWSQSKNYCPDLLL